jgi:hypothetical protein
MKANELWVRGAAESSSFERRVYPGVVVDPDHPVDLRHRLAVRHLDITGEALR